MSAVRTCVIGVGRVGSAHARILAARGDAELVGVCDADRARGERVARAVGCLHRPDLGRLLAEAEAAVVAVPTSSHEELARAALEAGCHVLVEKPLALTLEEADGLIELAERRGRRLCVGHVERYNGVLRRALPFLSEPRFIEILRLAPFEDRGTDVTVVLDLMIHDIDLVLGLLGSPVARLDAVGVPVLSGSVDIANARLRLENGAVADITASRVSAARERRLRAFQPTGYLSLDLAAGRGEFLRRRDAAATEAPGGSAGNGAGRARPAAAPSSLDDLVERIPLAADDDEPMERELAAFLAAVRGREAGVVTAREGRAALAVALDITREIERFVESGGAMSCR